MTTFVGILGDPAKYDQYDPDFYRILDWDTSESSFHLLGASEDEVSRKNYREMYERFEPELDHRTYNPIPGLSNPSVQTYQTRIGLFPSSTTHLIRGPSFTFAPYPINSTSRYLQFKSSFLQFLLRPFVPFKIRKLGYLPLGGKAASKTQADVELNAEEIPRIFADQRKNDKFDWYYLEAGSGQDFLDSQLIGDVLYAQQQVIASSIDLETVEPGTRVVVPRFIYGGGIKNVAQIRDLLGPAKNRVKLVPEIIIIGNLSEEDVGKTYELVEEIGILNEVPTVRLY